MHTECGILGRPFPASARSIASSARSMPSYCEPRKPAHSMGTIVKSTRGCISSHTATMSSPTISGPHALRTKSAAMSSSLASRIVRARSSSPPWTISSSQSFVHSVVV